MKSIDQKIVSISVAQTETTSVASGVIEKRSKNRGKEYPILTDSERHDMSLSKKAYPRAIQMHEGYKRPEVLNAKVYKLKTPLSERALFITISDCVLNKGTEHEIVQPFEIFINSRELKNYELLAAITLMISAVFRKGGDITFIVAELKSVASFNGGYIAKGGKYIPSLVAEIGGIIERHFIDLGLIKGEVLSQDVADKLKDKQDEFEAEGKVLGVDGETCEKCGAKSVVMQEGCLMCLSCAWSKCQ